MAVRKLPRFQSNQPRLDSWIIFGLNFIPLWRLFHVGLGLVVHCQAIPWTTCTHWESMWGPATAVADAHGEIWAMGCFILKHFSGKQFNWNPGLQGMINSQLLYFPVFGTWHPTNFPEASLLGALGEDRLNSWLRLPGILTSRFGGGSPQIF